MSRLPSSLKQPMNSDDPVAEGPVGGVGTAPMQPDSAHAVQTLHSGYWLQPGFSSVKIACGTAGKLAYSWFMKPARHGISHATGMQARSVQSGRQFWQCSGRGGGGGVWMHISPSSTSQSLFADVHSTPASVTEAHVDCHSSPPMLRPLQSSPLVTVNAPMTPVGLMPRTPTFHEHDCEESW